MPRNFSFIRRFGTHLQHLRVERNLTQQELATALNRLMGGEISQSYISKIESGRRLPSADIVAAMARVLGVSADYLLMLTDDASHPPPTDQATLIALVLDDLPEEVQTSLYQHITALVAWQRKRETFRDLEPVGGAVGALGAGDVHLGDGEVGADSVQ